MNKIALVAIIMGIGMSLIGCSNQGTSNKEDLKNNKITIEQAKEIALKHANLKSDQVSFIRADTELDNGVEKYDVEFYHNNKEYDYEINAADGKIIGYDYDVENYNIPQQQITNGDTNGNKNANTNEITVEKAKEIALKHANLKSDQVRFVRTEIDFDNGVKKYDIEFYHENKEYDYEINAADGQIISYDHDVEYNNVKQQPTNNNKTKITAEQAKEIALKHKNLKNNQVTFGKVELDFDDGIQAYDVEFNYNNIEYSYEIDANTGKILSYEQD